jgi:hypothetical protein
MRGSIVRYVSGISVWLPLVKKVAKLAWRNRLRASQQRTSALAMRNA